jgi:DNA (cytosine-5)-methyltransferase 1
MRRLTVLELCTGGGGQALGLEMAGIDCVGAVELEPRACETLKMNRPNWNILQADLRDFDARDFSGVDVVAAGVPCPPFSVAGKQLGAGDERDLFPEAIRVVQECRPVAILLENVPGFASAKFSGYRRDLYGRLDRLGYTTEWQLMNASDFGVPQLRPRFVLVAVRQPFFNNFEWPVPQSNESYVGPVLADLMSSRGWPGALGWSARANRIAPTIVGGSMKHGGPDLGPTRAKNEWRQLGVDPMGIADDSPDYSFPSDGFPRLTVRMVARLQSFPDDWNFSGRKTAAYRQVGNAFPPRVAQAIGSAIKKALLGTYTVKRTSTAQLRLFEKPGTRACRKL